MITPSKDVLPPALVLAFEELGANLGSEPWPQALRPLLAALAALPPDAAPRASNQIARLVNVPFSRSILLLKPMRLTEQQLLNANGDFAWLFMSHNSGFVREAALKRLQAPPTSPFFFALLTARLNDWVPQVRRAAMDCAQRLFPETAADVVAGCAFYLLERRFAWGRWHDEQAVLDSAFERRDVIARIAQDLAQGVRGPLVRTFLYALRFPAMDEHLPRLAATAVHGAVRAIALRALITGQATWREGWKKVWVDKTFNITRWAPVLGTRDHGLGLPADSLIAQGIYDSSAQVKRVAIDAMMAREAKVAGAAALIEALERDSRETIRTRAAFMRRQGWV